MFSHGWKEFKKLKKKRETMHILKKWGKEKNKIKREKILSRFILNGIQHFQKYFI